MRYPAQEKLKVLRMVLKDRRSVVEVCQEVGISRKTFYQWKRRYQSVSARLWKESLSFRYVSGVKHPRSKKTRFRNRLLTLVACRPEWGSRKISQFFKEGQLKLSPQAVYELLKAHKLNTKEKRLKYASLYHPFGKIKDLYQKKPLRLLPEERKRLVEAVFFNKERVTDVCQRALVSRKTFYKWKKRYLEAPDRTSLLEAMSDRYLKGKQHPRSISDEIEKKILRIVAKHPAYSAHRVASLLGEIGNHGVQNVFRRLGLNTYRLRLAYSQSRAVLR